METGRKLVKIANLILTYEEFRIPKKIVAENFIIKKKDFGCIVYKLNGRKPFIDIIISRTKIPEGFKAIIKGYLNSKSSAYKEFLVKQYLFGLKKNSPLFNPTAEVLLSKPFSEILEKEFIFYVVQRKPCLLAKKPLLRIKNSARPAWIFYPSSRIYIKWPPISIQKLARMKYFPSIKIAGSMVAVPIGMGIKLLKDKSIHIEEKKGEFYLVPEDIFKRMENNDSFKTILNLLKESRTVDLTFLCAKYYLLDYILTIADRFDIDTFEERAEFGELQNFLLDLFIEYIAFACYSELKHSRKKIAESWRIKQILNKKELKLFNCIPIDDVPSQRSFRLIKLLINFPVDNKIPDILKMAKKLFSLRWERGYGGEKWKIIADIGLKYVNEDINKSVFIDTVWNIQHNNGTFFDKGREFLYYGHVRDILDAKNEGEWEILLSKCPQLAKKLWEVKRYDR